MARLELRLLGPFQAILEQQPITTFESNKVRALLAYLAIESHRAHGRAELAALLWPDNPEAVARKSLRQALTTLRAAIQDEDSAPPF